MAKPIVAVVILGWNGKSFLENFLGNVVRFSESEHVKVVYADNASTDDSVAFVKQHFPTVEIVKNTSNSGFAGGYNEALAKVSADYFILLNQDVEVTENWVLPLFDFLEKNKDYGVVQPKLRAYHDQVSFEYAGAAGGYIDYLGYAFCRGRLFETMEKDEGQYDTAVPIFWASGAAMMIRADLYHNLGGLDVDFFAHQEEIDLCWRVQNAGYKIGFVSQSVVYHVGGGSLPQGNPRKTYLNFRNNLFLLLKNLPARKLWWVLPLRLKLDGLAIVYSIVKNKNFVDARAILKAHFHFVSGFSIMYAKRQQILTTLPESIYQKSIIWQYFAKGKKRYSDLDADSSR
jgi:GT2 family glycosyltransferase